MSAAPIIHCTKVPLRRVDCRCGHPWLSPPLLEPEIAGEKNVCPKCQSPALAHTAGPVKLYDLDIPINITASGDPTNGTR